MNCPRYIVRTLLSSPPPTHKIPEIYTRFNIIRTKKKKKKCFWSTALSAHLLLMVFPLKANSITRCPEDLLSTINLLFALDPFSVYPFTGKCVCICEHGADCKWTENRNISGRLWLYQSNRTHPSIVLF